MTQSAEMMLEPCPFCGGEAVVWPVVKPTCFQVGCKRCGGRSDGYPVATEAIAAWNTRASSPTADGRLAEGYIERDFKQAYIEMKERALDAEHELADLRKGRDQFAWLIEKGGSGSDLRYYAPTAPGEWTTDHSKACQFARKEDAEAVQFSHVIHGHLPERGTRVCEHGWLASTSHNILAALRNPLVSGEGKAEKTHEAPDWLWYGRDADNPIVTFGRWPRHGAKWRYKFAEIQPTEHDHAPVRRPVAFRVPRADPITGGISKTEWRLFADEEQAYKEAEQLGVDYQGLYVRDGEIK